MVCCFEAVSHPHTVITGSSDSSFDVISVSINQSGHLKAACCVHGGLSTDVQLLLPPPPNLFLFWVKTVYIRERHVEPMTLFTSVLAVEGPFVV